MPNLRFNNQIYKKEAIQKAIFAYSPLAKFKIKDDKDYIKVRVDPIGPKFKRILADEFANYVLGMMKKCL